MKDKKDRETKWIDDYQNDNICNLCDGTGDCNGHLCRKCGGIGYLKDPNENI